MTALCALLTADESDFKYVWVVWIHILLILCANGEEGNLNKTVRKFCRALENEYQHRNQVYSRDRGLTARELE